MWLYIFIFNFKPLPNLYKFKILVSGDDRASDFYREVFAKTFAYVQNRIPEISEDIHSIDSALRAGFGWKEGPFEIWNYIGVKEGVELMKKFDLEPAKWISEMISSNHNNFYSTKKYRKEKKVSKTKCWNNYFSWKKL